jgi:hypothetical protein
MGIVLSSVTGMVEVSSERDFAIAAIFRSSDGDAIIMAMAAQTGPLGSVADAPHVDVTFNV